jgi:hypothetical protein
MAMDTRAEQQARADDELSTGKANAGEAQRTQHIFEFFGSLQNDDGISLTIDEINEVIAKGWAGGFEEYPLL